MGTGPAAGNAGRPSIRAWLWRLAGCALLLWSAVRPAWAQQDLPLRVLLVGNSYLYSNDLPRELTGQAAGRHVRLEVTLLAKPDYALSDHLRDGRLQRLLDQRWDWVVLQQGPSALPASRDELRASVQRIDRLLPANSDTRLVLLSAWPQRRHAHLSKEAETSYRLAAQAVGACVAPAASAWRLAREQAPEVHLYQRDGMHPTRLGTQLAAMTLLDGLAIGSARPPVPPPQGKADAPALEDWSSAAVAGEVASCASVHSGR